MNSYSKLPIFLLVSLMISQAGTVAARASAILQLSDASSDETPASDLDARFEFSLAGSTLLLTVTNQTSTSEGFDISDIYFNGPPELSGMTLDGDSASDGWVIALDEQANGFGVFDFALLSELGNDLGEIAPGESREFELGLLGTGPFAETDFTSYFSTIPPGNRPALGAAKFTNGPGDDSAFGAVIIPEPASLLLLLAGVGFAARRRSRLHAFANH